MNKKINIKKMRGELEDRVIRKLRLNHNPLGNETILKVGNMDEFFNLMTTEAIKLVYEDIVRHFEVDYID